MTHQEDVHPRLYLVAPAEMDPHALDSALDAGDVACLLLRGADGESGPLVRTIQDRSVAVLVADDTALARRIGADGVHLSDSGADVAAARRDLGPDAIVGVACGGSRHAAMLAGEAGADYVAFAGRDGDEHAAADPDLLAWWQALMTVPCVAMGRVALPDVGSLAKAGADFVALEDAVWSHRDGPERAVTEALRAIASVTG